jgi:glycosyltransferase involved in cell wall biosynthesis
VQSTPLNRSTGLFWAANRVLGLVASGLAAIPRSKLRSGPLVSVVIATYNRPANLVLAIESVLRQHYRDFEVLVVGDGCTDDTEAVVKSISDPRVKWVSLESNSGSQSLPNNLGLANANGKYVAYLGHDDIWLPTHLSVLIKAMERRSLEVATTGCFMIGPPESRVFLASCPNLIRNQIIYGPPSALCHVREIVQRSGPWIDYHDLPARYPPDIEFIDRVSAVALKKESLRPFTVIKLNAAWRKNSYVTQDTSEQQMYLAQSNKPRRLTYELAYRTLLSRTFKRPKTDLPTANAQVLPGEHVVDTWRRIKGLGEPKPD